ncbi:MAG: polysaccharide biosynthesis protein, partial [Syntrophomonadaceae bacterium]|nr:polysaccharide biosynthesis protein [Syntrophomonadaceae bacterium]
MNNRLRLVTLLLVDSLLTNASVLTALALRFEGRIPPVYLQAYVEMIPLLTSFTVASLVGFRLYHRVWEYASVGELVAIVRAITSAAAATVAAVYAFGLAPLPRSVYILSWLINTVAIGTSRMWWRLLRDLLAGGRPPGSRRVLVVGAGQAGSLLAREFKASPHLGLAPVGYIDDDPRKQRLMLHGIPVLGTRADIPRVVRDHQVEEIIIALPGAGGRVVRELYALCQQTAARVRILPPIYGSASRSGLFARLRDVRLEDLLHRRPVEVDLEQVAGYLQGKVVLVTGAGGSIGAELCRQVLRFNPEALVLVDNSENGLFEIEMELDPPRLDRCPIPRIVPLLADVRDEEQVARVFARWRPQVVFHAAAYKHVPMMERHPEEAVRNNVLGTRCVALAALQHGVERFILISTDKAVHPTSVMGATKRLAEMVVRELNGQGPTVFAAVRFGNVLGSRGSVVPLFQKQIEAGGPVTVTHPEMTRYFMTISEAVQLVIQ